MNRTAISDSDATLEEMANQLSHLKITNINSSVLQQLTLHSPYMIFWEICREKDESFHIYQITPASSVSSQYTREQQQLLVNRPLHKHNFIEIMFVLSGSVTNRIENQRFTYTQGQCCVMNSNICHCEVFSGNFQAVFFMFQDDFLGTILTDYMDEVKITAKAPEPGPLFQLFRDTAAKEHLFDKIYLDCLPCGPANDIMNQFIPLFHSIIMETMEKKAGFLLYVKGAFTRMFHFLSTPSLYSVERLHSQASQHEYLTAKMIHILEANHGHCTRQQLTEQLHYTGEYLNRILKKYTGKTISEYRQHIILKEGERLLLDTDRSISDIITDLGFSNRNYFYQLFEESYGMTPLEYRQRCKADSQASSGP